MQTASRTSEFAAAESDISGPAGLASRDYWLDGMVPVRYKIGQYHAPFRSPATVGRMLYMRTKWEGLKGHRAAVLGSTSGIGRATALTLAAAGASVIIHGNRSKSEAEKVADECRTHGVEAEVLMADLASRSAGDELVEKAWNVWGGLDSWLHFAGADTLTGPASKLSFDEKLDILLSVDVVATTRLCRAIGRKMVDAGSGSIVTMGWDLAETGMEGDSGELFSVAKGAVIAFTRSLSLSLAPKVRVNAVSPGWIKTAWGQCASQAWQDRVLRETPMRRWGTPAEVASAALFLVGPESAFFTGQVVRVNGGAVR
jgi:3-oxoacyl-[acyl-carrier protein] reductase